MVKRHTCEACGRREETSKYKIYGWEGDALKPFKTEAQLCDYCVDGTFSNWRHMNSVAINLKNKGKRTKPATVEEINKTFTYYSYNQDGTIHSKSFETNWQEFQLRLDQEETNKPQEAET